MRKKAVALVSASGKAAGYPLPVPSAYHIGVATALFEALCRAFRAGASASSMSRMAFSVAALR